MSTEEDWWWVDYLEDEIEPGLRADLDVLLEHSDEDRKTCAGLARLRAWLKVSDLALEKESEIESRITRMHERVMNVVQSEPVSRPRDSLRR